MQAQGSSVAGLPAGAASRAGPGGAKRANVGAVILVILLGLGVGALGLVASDLYAVGVLIGFLGFIGLAVVAGDRVLRYAQRQRPPP